MTDRSVSAEKSAGGEQRLLLLDRTTLELTGVEDVVSFDETGAVLKTGLGLLAVEGEGLHAVKLDLAAGLMLVEGRIDGLLFSATGKTGKNRKRFLR